MRESYQNQNFIFDIIISRSNFVKLSRKLTTTIEIKIGTKLQLLSILHSKILLGENYQNERGKFRTPSQSVNSNSRR